MKYSITSAIFLTLCVATAQAIVLDIDGAHAEFPDYLIPDNTKDIPTASQTDGTATLSLVDDAEFQWFNFNYPFFEQSMISFHPGGWLEGPEVNGGVHPKGSSSLTESLEFDMYYTIQIDSVVPINLESISIDFYRADDVSPRRYYILDDADGNGFDIGDIIADSADLPSVDASGLLPFEDFGSGFTQTLSATLDENGITSKTYRFYLSNTPNLAGPTHWTFAGIEYSVIPEPSRAAFLIAVFTALLAFRRKRV